MTKKEVIDQIEKSVLKIDTLEKRFSDSLDYHNLAVWTIEEALEKAYEVGKQAK